MSGHKTSPLVGLAIALLVGLTVITTNYSTVHSETSDIVTTHDYENDSNDNKDNFVPKFSTESVMKEMRLYDAGLVSAVLNVSLASMSEPEARDLFYKAVSRPLLGVCHSLKRVGGVWTDLGYSKSIDGDKFICMDTLYSADKCLIYSFGIR